MDWDVWGLPLVVLGTSIVIGIFIAFRDGDKSVRKDRSSELEAQKDHMQLLELLASQRKALENPHQRTENTSSSYLWGSNPSYTLWLWFCHQGI